MKRTLLVLIVIFGCGESKPETKFSKAKVHAKKHFSETMGIAGGYNILPPDSMIPYVERFTAILMDSSDSYANQYAMAMRYLVDRKCKPTDEAVRWRIGHLLEPLPERFKSF
jgi:hypothetical protein